MRRSRRSDKAVVLVVTGPLDSSPGSAAQMIQRMVILPARYAWTHRHDAAPQPARGDVSVTLPVLKGVVQAVATRGRGGVTRLHRRLVGLPSGCE